MKLLDQADRPLRSQQFTKLQRLLTRSDFDAVFSSCHYRASHQYFLILAKPNDFLMPRLGLVIAKRHIRLAVQRNRIKRLIRESFRHQQNHLPAIDAIVLSRKGLGQLNNSTILKILNQLWQTVRNQARAQLS